ncbi:hypothetical protein SAMN05443428_10756 [Caloramator quimbayensis]|uniref:Uncharacterized protein n=1 Tax=Caloramator quimbayensis TaxID=1147123 RepID=A0A1T4XAT1_9CLOT|nr:hypothetical protein [Caloramator quimbayensis]SKA86218.1 hypothetical protein SAMN05443428_10756 [Caloramator quimbayensis]
MKNQMQIVELKKYVNKIYNNMNNNTVDFNLFIKVIDNIFCIANNISDENDINYLNEKLSDMLNAFEEKDYDMFLDILSYEIIPMFEEV